MGVHNLDNGLSVSSLPPQRKCSLPLEVPGVENATGRSRISAAVDAISRRAWHFGSVVEVFSASAGRWHPAYVSQIAPGEGGIDVLTVQFFPIGGPKQKSMHRSDCQLAQLGAHTSHVVPPGFSKQPSQSCPGEIVYCDIITCAKYASPEQAWRVHFERMLQAPSTTCMRTIRSVGTGIQGQFIKSETQMSCTCPITMFSPSITNGSLDTPICLHQLLPMVQAATH